MVFVKGDSMTVTNSTFRHSSAGAALFLTSTTNSTVSRTQVRLSAGVYWSRRSRHTTPLSSPSARRLAWSRARRRTLLRPLRRLSRLHQQRVPLRPLVHPAHLARPASAHRHSQVQAPPPIMDLSSPKRAPLGPLSKQCVHSHRYRGRSPERHSAITGGNRLVLPRPPSSDS